MSNYNFLHRVGLGREPGASPLVKFGFKSNVGTTRLTLWPEDAALTYRTTAIAMQIASTDAKDNGASSPLGVGAQTVQVFGLDANYAEIDEIVTLEGISQVETTNEYLRVFRMIALSAGSEADNAGIIYCGTGLPSPFTGKPAVVHSLIAAGENQSEQCFYTVPAGKTALLEYIFGSVGTGKILTIALYARPLGETFQNKGKLITTAAPAPVNPPPYQSFEEKTDVELRASVDSTTGAASGIFVLTLFDNIGS